jgi:hypothetical protein
MAGIIGIEVHSITDLAELAPILLDQWCRVLSALCYIQLGLPWQPLLWCILSFLY